MATVDLDFILNNENGDPDGNAYTICADEIQNYINLMTHRGFVEIANWCSDYQAQLRSNKSADMEDPQYSTIRDYYTTGLSGFLPIVKAQIVARFPRFPV